MNSALMFGKASDEWTTPDVFYHDLDDEFNFTVDAAASSESAKCRIWFGPGGLAPDALALKDWRPDVARAIFLNPPYSRCAEFIAKAASEAMDHGCTVVCLVPARTDTRWWHAHVYNQLTDNWRKGVEVRFVKGRLKFGDGKNSAPFPSVVVIFRGVQP